MFYHDATGWFGRFVCEEITRTAGTLELDNPRYKSVYHAPKCGWGEGNQRDIALFAPVFQTTPVVNKEIPGMTLRKNGKEMVP